MPARKKFPWIPTSTAQLSSFITSYGHDRADNAFNFRSNYHSIPAPLGETRFGSLAMVSLAWFYWRGARRNDTSRAKAGRVNTDPLTDPVHHLFLAVAASMAFMPLHSCDLVACAVMIILLPAVFTRWPRSVSLATIFLAGRSGNVTEVVARIAGTGSPRERHFVSNYLVSIVVITILVCWGLQAQRFRRRCAEMPVK